MYKLSLKTPLVIFDIESTGISVTNDRIVEIALIKILPNNNTEQLIKRFNPTIPIPREASMIHGIYDKDVENEITFKEYAKTLAKWLEGCDLGGFNAIHFDIPLLIEEFLRVNQDFEMKNKKIIDALKIFHLMEKRNLSAAYEFYCGKKLENAHTAMSDTQATYEVFLAQIKKYENKEAMDGLGNKLGKIENKVESIHQLCLSNKVDFAGRIILKNKTEYFNFGKYKNQVVLEVFEKDPSYYNWIMNNDFPLDTKRKLTQIKLKKSKLSK